VPHGQGARPQPSRGVLRQRAQLHRSARAPGHRCPGRQRAGVRCTRTAGATHPAPGFGPADPRFEILLRMRARTAAGWVRETGRAGGPSRIFTAESIGGSSNTPSRGSPSVPTSIARASREILPESVGSLAWLTGNSGACWKNWCARAASNPEPWVSNFRKRLRAHTSNHRALHVPLREQGVSFALGQFRRGIGSLAHLNSLPVSCIKIDGSFSRDLLDNPRSQSMVVAIAELAHTFGLETVAGNVETDAIRARAAQLGVDYGQGFFIGKALALDDAIHDLPLYSVLSPPPPAVRRRDGESGRPGRLAANRRRTYAAGRIMKSRILLLLCMGVGCRPGLSHRRARRRSAAASR
jgi:hypothetical protein